MKNPDGTYIFLTGLWAQDDGRFTITFTINGKYYTQNNISFCCNSKMYDIEDGIYFNINFEVISNNIKELYNE